MGLGILPRQAAGGTILGTMNELSSYHQDRRADSLPLRFLPLFGSAVLFLLAAFTTVAFGIGWWALLLSAALLTVGLYDLLQKKHAVLRNYPISGHMRYIFESIRPEIRQYFLEEENARTPFSRAQRSLVYQRAKAESDKRPFGTQLDVAADGYEWINHSLHPRQIASHDFRVDIGNAACTQPYSASVFNISAMSFGSLSANAILALNTGAKAGGFAHDTGEGAISVYHRQHGGDLIWEIGSGYFGCRDADGRFDPEKFASQAQDPQVKMIEIKLSQGAKPGQGGLLPASKITPEIAQARGIPMGQDCHSPAAHSAFSTPLEMVAFIQQLRDLSGGKPVGIKLCIGHPWEWFAMVKAMVKTGIVPDFVVVDGAEGGTGAAPLEFTDHVGVPLQEGLQLVHNTLIGAGLRSQVKIGCAGKVISAFDVVRMMALGADWCNSARGFMFALGCIQSLQCHSNRCPTGVATQDPSRQRALDPLSKAERVQLFHANTLKAVKEMVQAAGLEHPNDITGAHIVRRVSANKVQLLSRLLMQVHPEDLLKSDLQTLPAVFRYYWPVAQAETFACAMH